MIRRKVITPAASSLLAILKQFIKEVRVGRDYNIEIVLNVPLDEFEELKRHAASAGRGKNQKNKSQNPQKSWALYIKCRNRRFRQNSRRNHKHCA